jgi:hypothetical protein
MIVRISGEDQYELEDSERARLGELDTHVQQAIEAGDQEAFRDGFDSLLEFVRATGKVVPDDDLEVSDLILPPPDLTLSEARDEFSSEGLLPD